MTASGPEEFGDPCRECGYHWTASPTEIIRAHAQVHDALATVTADEFNVSMTPLSWSVGAYVCHIADNERIWAERFAAADDGHGTLRIAPFDQDKLAMARNYHLVGHASAMWSLRRAFEDFTETSRGALRQAAILQHPERGQLSALDAVRTVVHDCHHHWWDIRRILAGRNRSTKIQGSAPSQSDFLAVTRDSYDRTADGYALRFHHHLDDKPIDQAMVSAFARLILEGDNKRVVDVGCGTGVTTAFLADYGLDAVGIDLSANMIAHAQRLNPDLQFRVGSMLALEVADGSVGGVCAWYSIIHVPDEYLADVFAEFHRVLVPTGLVLLAFQVGDQPRVLTHAFDQQVELTFIRRQPQIVAKQLIESGFRMYAELVRQPDGDGREATPQAYLIARKAWG